MTYYTKDENGELSDATNEVNNIVKSRLADYKRTATEDIRKEAEAGLRDELMSTVGKETEDRVKGEFQPKLDEAESNIKKLETSLRQKTIAAEYGFKPGSEKYLGEGSEDEMRKEADTLKTSFSGNVKAPDKETGSEKSKTQERTGISVTI